MIFLQCGAAGLVLVGVCGGLAVQSLSSSKDDAGDASMRYPADATDA